MKQNYRIRNDLYGVIHEQFSDCLWPFTDNSKDKANNSVKNSDIGVDLSTKVFL